MKGRRTVSALILILLAIAGAPSVSAAQDDDTQPLYLSVRSDGALEIRIGNLLDEGGLTRALHSGLPLRILIVAELWKDGFFDSQKGRAEWRASVIYEPLEERYQISTAGEGGRDVVVSSLDRVRRVLQERFELPLRPQENGGFYYRGEVEVETLSLSDLEELQTWLRGDLASVVSGETQVEDAVGSGVRRMLVRMLGLPARRFRVRSPTFEVPEEPR